jgi:hypothetical protein
MKIKEFLELVGDCDLRDLFNENWRINENTINYKLKQPQEIMQLAIREKKKKSDLSPNDTKEQWTSPQQ